MTLVLVDEYTNESYPGINYFMACHVIASDDAVERFRLWCRQVFEPDTLRFKQKSKVHYTDEDTATKQVLVEAVKDLDVTAKMYIWGDQNDIDKAHTMQWSFEFQLQTDANSQFVVEQSGVEYADLSAENVVVSEFKDYPELAIADIFMGVFSSKFTASKGSCDSSIERFYRMLYPRIRLEIERKPNGDIEKRTRSTKTK